MIRTEFKGQYILAVEGNPPLGEDGVFCIPGGEPFVNKLKRMSRGRGRRHRLGLVRLVGLRAGREAEPDAGDADPQGHQDKPIVKVPGCPPIAEVMTGVITYYVTFGELPALDRQGRPLMFYSQRVHDKCYRRGHFDAGQFAETFDDEARARATACTRWDAADPTTYNACSTMRWNEGVSFPIGPATAASAARSRTSGTTGRSTSGSETFPQFGSETNANRVGATAAAVVGVGIAAHAGLTALRQAKVKPNSPSRETEKSV